MKIGKVYLVHWFDHWSSNGWRAVKEFHISPLICRTIGWLTAENEDMIVLAATLDELEFTDTIHMSSRQGIIKTDIVNCWELTGV